MKTIIIPTDFSPLADTAMQYGAQLAQAIGAGIVLLSVYMVPVTINEVPVPMITADELKNSADEGLQRVQQQLQQSFPNVPVQAESRLGDIVDELQNLCADLRPFAVIMGLHQVSDIEQTLFGSNTLSAIRHIRYPIIAISEHTVFQLPHHIVLATDLDNLHKFPADKITQFVQALNARLTVVHVTEKGAAMEETARATQLQDKLHLLQPEYHLVRDDEVAHGLQQYIQEQQADWLLLIPHEHHFFQRLFSKTHLKSILDQTSIPVVSIAE